MQNNIIKKILSPAKINLDLYITGFDNQSNLHKIYSNVRKINFYDEISFIKNNNIEYFNIEIIYGDWFKFKDHDIEKINAKKNIFIKSIQFFEKYSGLKVKNLSILCKKNIPYGSGLGGASSNAAETIKFLIEYYNINFDDKILTKIATEVGSDVLLFFNSHNAKNILIENIGDQIKITDSSLNDKNKFVSIYFPYKIFNPKDMFLKFSSFNKFDKKPKNNTIINLNHNNHIFHNSFLDVIPEKQIINLFFSYLKNKDGLYGLSGSGSSCFVIHNDKEIMSDFQKKEFLFGPFKFL